MTYPGLPGQVGPPPQNTTGWQVRQSRAGEYPGYPDWVTLWQSMGSYAPALGVKAAQVTVAQEVSADPHPIEAENFELADALGGIDQFGVDQASPSTFVNDADPGYTGM
jgi:hypothetical protein